VSGPRRAGFSALRGYEDAAGGLQGGDDCPARAPAPSSIWMSYYTLKCRLPHMTNWITLSFATFSWPNRSTSVF
jgi:hypothetical protein